MKIKEMIKGLEEGNLIERKKIDKEQEIKSVTYNSKEVIKDTLFICKGYNFKEEYVKEAEQRGAICYISEKEYNTNMNYIIVKDIRKSMALIGKEYYKTKEQIKKIGITGTKGKTTTIYFIHNILNEYNKRKTAYISTIDYYIGKEVKKSHNTTPESLELYKYIKEAEENKYKEIVMEISSQAEKLDRIYGLTFDVGAITNIGKDHISPREHPNYEDYLGCKIKFLKKCKKVYINKEIEEYERIEKELKDKEIITYGVSKSDYQIKEIRKEGKETVFKVNEEEYRLKIRGKFNCLNACLAVSICKDLNIPYEDIYKGLYITEVPGRMTVYEDGVCPIIVDYAHNKLSIENLFKVIKEEYPNNNIKLVVGCPGDKALNRRKEVADLASNFCSYVYITAEDPGSKNVLDIAKEIASYLDTNIAYEIILDRETAIKKAINTAKKDDIILIIGKGDETYQLVDDKYIEYKSDLKVVEENILTVTN